MGFYQLYQPLPARYPHWHIHPFHNGVPIHQHHAYDHCVHALQKLHRHPLMIDQSSSLNFQSASHLNRHQLRSGGCAFLNKLHSQYSRSQVHYNVMDPFLSLKVPPQLLII